MSRAVGAAESTVAGERDRPDGWTTLGYALVFSVPAGVGVTAAVTRVAGVPLLAPTAVGPGLGAALALFAFVLFAVHTGEADPRRGGDP